jgi:hypothetical protein
MGGMFESRTVLVLGLVVMTLACPGWAQAGTHATPVSKCDAMCLTTAMDDVLEKFLTHRTNEIKVAPNVQIYVNTHASRLEDVPLLRVKEIKSKQVFSDSVTGNALARTGVEMSDGAIAYASTRLEIAGGEITQIEISFDDSSHVVPSYVTFLDPLMTTIVPPEKRSSREELKATIERYFQSLTDHTALAADFDERCDRYHSGQRITNNPSITIESNHPMTCYTAVVGPRPWGPATNIHIPLVDAQHGIVAGYTLLLYRNDNAPMYVSEVFKILDGKIRMIDNIGLKAAGMQPVPF